MRSKLLLLTGLLSGSFAFGQTDCTIAMRGAEQAYRFGQFEHVINMLSPCVREERHKKATVQPDGSVATYTEVKLADFNRDEKAEAYRLMALSYYNLHNETLPDDLTEKLLRVNPEYNLRADDPPAFRKLVNNYKIKEIRIGLLAGVNTSMESNQYVFDQVIANESVSSDFNFIGGLIYERPVHPMVNVDVGVMYETFRSKTSLFFAESTVPNTMTRELSYVKVPLQFHFFPPVGFLQRKVQIGAGYGFSFKLKESNQFRSGSNDLENSFDGFLPYTRHELLFSLRYNKDYRKVNLKIFAQYGLDLFGKTDTNQQVDDGLFATGFLSEQSRINQLQVGIILTNRFFRIKKAGK